MPISADNFNKEKKPTPSKSLRERIVSFLEGNKNNAYTEAEITSALYPNEELRSEDTLKISLELLFLEMRKVIEAKEILVNGNFVKHYKAK